MRPFDGLAFLTSAISAGRPSARCASIAAAKPRAGAAVAARRFDLGLRHRRFRGGDLLALVGFDAGENVAHFNRTRSGVRGCDEAVERRSRGAAIERPGCPVETIAKVARFLRQ